MTPSTAYKKKQSRRTAASSITRRHAHSAHFKRLQLYAVVTGIVGLFMTIIRLIISLTH